MKKTIVLLIASLLVLICVGTAPACCVGSGLQGLEITGGSAVGAQLYLGNSCALTKYNSAFSKSLAIDKVQYVGAALMTSANGAATLSTSGYSPGGISGTGEFKSHISGSILGVDFYTSSRVNISGWSK